eukprot:5897942-Pyramimonas_sp.AAC.1
MLCPGQPSMCPAAALGLVLVGNPYERAPISLRVPCWGRSGPIQGWDYEWDGSELDVARWIPGRPALEYSGKPRMRAGGDLGICAGPVGPPV